MSGAARAAGAAGRDWGPVPLLGFRTVAELHVDARYQRSLESKRSQQNIARIVAGFRWAAFGAVLVTARDEGGWWLLDGQHRVAAARQLGINAVPCVEVAAADVADQARLFVAANRDRVAVNPFALHHALVAAGDADARAIAAACRRAGIEVARYPIPATSIRPLVTLAPGAVLAALRDQGEAATGRALKLLAEIYADVPGALRAATIKGLAALLHDTPAVRDEAVRAALRRIAASTLDEKVRAQARADKTTQHAAWVAIVRGLLARARAA